MNEAAQVSMAEPKFTAQWEGCQAGLPQSRSAMLAANLDDDYVCSFLLAAKVGEELKTGGGAAPACTLRRVS